MRTDYRLVLHAHAHAAYSATLSILLTSSCFSPLQELVGAGPSVAVDGGIRMRVAFSAVASCS